MKYKVVFFDADGVILQGGYRFTDKLAEQYGLKIEDMLPFFQGPFLECSLGKADVKEELAKVIQDWGWQGTVDELMEFWLTEGTVFDKENAQLAAQLSQKGIHCFIATGQEQYRGEFIKKTVGHGHPFDDVFYTAEMGVSKKDPRYFEMLFERVKHLTADRSQILMVDDSRHVIDMAKEFGFATILYTKPDDLEELRSYV